MTTSNQRIFWVIETFPNGDRLDHFCHLHEIPSIVEFNPESKCKFRHLWNGVFLRMPLHELNNMFQANNISFRFSK